MAQGWRLYEGNQGRREEVIEEEEFVSILSVARRVLDVYGRPDPSDPPRISHAHRDVNITGKRGVIDIFFRGSLVFRYDPKGGITDFFETSGIWMDEMERMARKIPSSSSGVASQIQYQRRKEVSVVAAQQRVLDALQRAARSWDDLKKVARMNDERLGLMLGELLNERLIWTERRDDDSRVYGIERRTGLVPRFANPQRRATDLRQKGTKK